MNLKESHWYHFEGSVQPKSWRFTQPMVSLRPSDAAEDFRLSFAAKNGRVVAYCIAPPAWELLEVRNRVETAIRTIVSAYAFVDRAALYVAIHDVTSAAGSGFLNRIFDELRPGGLSKERLSQLVLGESRLSTSLQEHANAIANPQDTPFHAFRGLESIRIAIAGPGTGTKAEWKAMRDALRIEKEYLDPLTNLGTQNRHGQLHAVTHDERVRCISILRTVIERFVEWVERGKPRTLPSTEFREITAADLV